MKLSEAKDQFNNWLLARGRSESTAKAYMSVVIGYSKFLKKHSEAVSLFGALMRGECSLQWASVPTKHAPDVAKATAQKGVLHKNRSGKRAGVA